MSPKKRQKGETKGRGRGAGEKNGEGERETKKRQGNQWWPPENGEE